MGKEMFNGEPTKWPLTSDVFWVPVPSRQLNCIFNVRILMYNKKSSAPGYGEQFLWSLECASHCNFPPTACLFCPILGGRVRQTHLSTLPGTRTDCFATSLAPVTRTRACKYAHASTYVRACPALHATCHYAQRPMRKRSPRSRDGWQ